MSNVLIVGAMGMLGHTLFTELEKNPEYTVYGTERTVGGLGSYVTKAQRERIIEGIDVENLESLTRVFAQVKPAFVINCVGLVKQRPNAKDPLLALSLNSVLPHRLAILTESVGGRYFQLSTDCVFDGKRGGYTEEDTEFASDIYGTSKRLGEVTYGNALTIRTSIIGHELSSHQSLVDWFMAQEGSVDGYTGAIFSGFPTVYIAHLLDKVIFPNPKLSGLYHVSADPINKLDLLTMIAKTYNKEITIVPKSEPVVERALDSTKFRKETGFTPPSWPELISIMHEHFLASSWYSKEV